MGMSQPPPKANPELAHVTTQELIREIQHRANCTVITYRDVEGSIRTMWSGSFLDCLGLENLLHHRFVDMIYDANDEQPHAKSDGDMDDADDEGSSDS